MPTPNDHLFEVMKVSATLEAAQLYRKLVAGMETPDENRQAPVEVDLKRRRHTDLCRE